MARSRLIYRESLTDVKLNVLSLAEQAVFFRLLLIADDNGAFPAEPKALYKTPVLRNARSEAQVLRNTLDKMERLGITVGYTVDITDANGDSIAVQRLYYFQNWHKYQKMRPDIKKQILYPEPPQPVQNRDESDTDATRTCSKHGTLHPHPSPHSLTHPQEKTGVSNLARRVGKLGVKADMSRYSIKDVEFYAKVVEGKIARGEKIKDPAGLLVSLLKKNCDKTKDKTLSQALVETMKK